MHATMHHNAFHFNWNTTCGDHAGSVAGWKPAVGSFRDVLQLFQDVAEILADLHSQLLNLLQTFAQALQCDHTADPTDIETLVEKLYIIMHTSHYIFKYYFNAYQQYFIKLILSVLI